MLRRIFSGLLIVALGVLGFFWWGYHQPSHPREVFSKDRWAASQVENRMDNDPGCFRGGMALDLLERHSLTGLQAAEVTALLGEPQGQSAGIWHYDVGQCSHYGWGNSELRVTFDSGGRVEAARFGPFSGPLLH